MSNTLLLGTPSATKKIEFLRWAPIESRDNVTIHLILYSQVRETGYMQKQKPRLSSAGEMTLTYLLAGMVFLPLMTLTRSPPTRTSWLGPPIKSLGAQKE